MEKSNKERRRAALGRGLFAASLVAVGAAAVSPDWAATLKAQGYYGSVDLGVALTPSQTPRAGETVDFLVTVRNGGPDAANRVRTIAGAQNLHVLETSGCAADPLGYPQCALPSPLAAGVSGDYLLRMKVPSAARGNVVLSVSATSDEDEIAPGDEVALVKMPIDVVVDGRTSTTCDQSFVMPGSKLRCVFDFANNGPSNATVIHLVASAPYAASVVWSCASSRPALCANPYMSNTYAELYSPDFAPDDWVRLTGAIDVGTNLPPVNDFFVYSNVHSNDTDDDIGNNQGSVLLPITLFRDGFEPTSTPPNP